MAGPVQRTLVADAMQKSGRHVPAEFNLLSGVVIDKAGSD